MNLLSQPTIRFFQVAMSVAFCAGLPVVSAFGQRIEEGYGRMTGAEYRNSLNGTLILSELFAAEGFTVRRMDAISPRIEQADVLVWMPDRLELPSPGVTTRLESWLTDEAGRTLVYVVRDYDAGELYWDKMLSEAETQGEDAATLSALKRQLAHAQRLADQRRAQHPGYATHSWVEVNYNHKMRRVRDIQGRWAAGVDSADTEIFLRSTIADPWANTQKVDQWGTLIGEASHCEKLLVGKNELLAFGCVYEARGGESQLIVIANAGFLSNYGLTNQAHRKLADNMIRQLDTFSYRADDKQVVFLESGPEEIQVGDNEPETKQDTPWDWMSVWPLNFVVPHLFALMLVYCFARFPIFGRAKELKRKDDADFGRHIAALGRLFARTQDGNYMLNEIKSYQENVRRESGAPHAADD